MPLAESYFSNKWVEPSGLEQKAESIRREGKTVVTLNGSFDLLHAGHLQIIEEASFQGDVLFVLLNTDESIQQYKSPSRPIVPLPQRLRMVAALEFVSFVSCFSEVDPREVLKKIRPNVHVNGAEYGDNCIEAEVVKQNGGRIHIVHLVPGLSTSNLIKKIVDTCV